MTFSSIVGQEDAKLALILNAIDPRCGGVLFVGEKGSGKSTLARSFAELTGEGRPFVELPLNATEDAVLGDVDLENTLITGTECRRPGLLERAAGGTLYIDASTFFFRNHCPGIERADRLHPHGNYESGGGRAVLSFCRPLRDVCPRRGPEGGAEKSRRHEAGDGACPFVSIRFG